MERGETGSAERFGGGDVVEGVAGALELLWRQHVVVEQLGHDEHVTDVDDALLSAALGPVGIGVQEGGADGLGPEVGAAAEAGAHVRGDVGQDYPSSRDSVELRGRRP
jgi:hypothetical protein